MFYWNNAHGAGDLPDGIEPRAVTVVFVLRSSMELGIPSALRMYYTARLIASWELAQRTRLIDRDETHTILGAFKYRVYLTARLPFTAAHNDGCSRRSLC